MREEGIYDRRTDDARTHGGQCGRNPKGHARWTLYLHCTSWAGCEVGGSSGELVLIKICTIVSQGTCSSFQPCPMLHHSIIFATRPTTKGKELTGEEEVPTTRLLRFSYCTSDLTINAPHRHGSAHGVF